MKEIWKDIVGYEGLYQVSNMGRVRRFYKNGKKKILATRSRKDGYYDVHLSKNGKHIRLLLHRLVAQAFLPNPNNYPVINHKDENRKNSYVENLEWCSYQYNSLYNNANKKGAMKRINHPKKSKPVNMINPITNEIIKTFPSLSEAYRETGISAGCICWHIKGKRFKLVSGYKWEYA